MKFSIELTGWIRRLLTLYKRADEVAGNINKWTLIKSIDNKRNVKQKIVV